MDSVRQLSLEVDLEVGLYYLLGWAAGAVAEDQVVLHWVIQRGGEAKLTS